jgi:hypothetical protein
MNTIENSVTPWRRFVQVGFISVQGLLVTSGIYAYTLHVLQAESAKASVMMLAGGLLWIAMLLWGIFFLQLMVFLNTKCTNVGQPNNALQPTAPAPSVLTDK